MGVDIKWEDIDISGVAKKAKATVELLKAGLSYFVSHPTRLAITGMEGVGKSVLTDFLIGEARKEGYKPPLRSQSLETGKIKGESKAIRLQVIPGQAKAPPRLDSLEKIFGGKRPPDGVIHVVSFGHAVLRSEEAIRAQIDDLKNDTIAKLRKDHLDNELEDLEEICRHIRRCQARYRKPKWVVVAVDKIDLFYSKLSEARKHYSDPTKPFHEQLLELSHQVGTDNFRWELAPVCARLVDFEWNTKRISPQLNEEQRDAYISQFLSLLESYCGN